MEFQFLADHKKFIPLIAEWYFLEWGHHEHSRSVQIIKERLHNYLNKDKIPFIIMAIEDNELLGVAQLKYHEMDIYKDKEHWLGGVYVSKKQRGQKIAEKIIHNIVITAKNLNVSRLYLQTERLDGGLYSTLGWQGIEKVKYKGLDVLVMGRDL